jgi:hypothetical protein
MTRAHLEAGLTAGQGYMKSQAVGTLKCQCTSGREVSPRGVLFCFALFCGTGD